MESSERQALMDAKVYIILLNWNSWIHTIECLESLFRSQHPSWQIIVCDNHSEDQSLAQIKAWAEGKNELTATILPQLQHLVFPPIPKPVPYVEYDTQTLPQAKKTQATTRLILIQTGANLGFSGGCNVGLRYAMQCDDFEYVWLLNNDTVVKPNALSLMIKKIQSAPDYGICGSTLAYYHRPEIIQTRGGNAYNRILGTTRHLGFGEALLSPVEETCVEKQMACVIGASMLVRKQVLKQVGLLSEEYFLYFEELDWAIRAGKMGFRLAYASQSTIYHKEGASIGGGNRNRSEKNLRSDYYEIRNRLVLARKFYPWALPTVCLALGITLINRIRRHQWDRIPMIFKTIRDAFRVPLPPQ
ncbi:glycosyltransferase family 2 protein [Deltaproteobacteria bacterium TL4]